MKKRMLIGIIGADVYKFTQRNIIKGAVFQAQKYKYDVAVISNNFNVNTYDKPMPFENRVYDLINSDDYDGLIVLSESLNCENVRNYIHRILLKKSIPIVVAGAELCDFELPDSVWINTNDLSDIEEITDHLIDVHGFRDIDFLTGFYDIPVSHQRLNGYKKSLEKHGIPFDENKVIFGDFWTISGRKLAREYISGERRCPEAVICANDYSAFGVIDEFAERDLDIKKYFAIIGYDFSNNRCEHNPLLTTYDRNREQLGKDAVDIMIRKINGLPCEEFQPPQGIFINGTSCSCRWEDSVINSELFDARENSKYSQWYLIAQMDHKLTECRTLDEFIKVLGELQYIVRSVSDITICLFDGWYESHSEINKISLICQSVMPWNGKEPFTIKHYEISDIFRKNDKSAVYYINPLSFKDRLFGYIVLRYDSPDTYDWIYGSWINSVSNGLEFLRMKNDINYLMECRSIQEDHDSLTNLKNDKGMQRSYELIINAADKISSFYAVLLKICLFNDNYDDENKITSIIDAADAVMELSHQNVNICGRIDNTTFLCFIQTESRSEESIADDLYSILTQHKVYLANYGMDSFLSCVIQCKENESYNAMKQKCFMEIERKAEKLYNSHNIKHYEKMINFRNDIYLNPTLPPAFNEVCRKFSLSEGHFRLTYKKCFGINIHSDIIKSRISLAKYLIYTTDMPIITVSDKCGYEDVKYFLKLFQNCTGFTPKQYRKLVKNNPK